MKFEPCRKNESSGSSLISYIDISYSDLERVFGPPHIDGSPDGKTEVGWQVKFEDGTVATIYDYKTGCPAAENREWNIGGFSQSALTRVAAHLDDFGIQFEVLF